MNFIESYQSWKARRNLAYPPPGFADRVMGRIRLEPSHGQTGAMRTRVLPRYAAAAGIGALLAGGLIRAAGFIALLMAMSEKGL